MLPILPGMTLLDRMVLAVERVRDRLKRATAALESAGVPYAVAGGNAVAAWVATVDAGAVRNTKNVDILVRRSDFEAAATSLQNAGFVRRGVAEQEVFLDGPDARTSGGVTLLIAGAKIRPAYLTAAPEVEESEMLGQIRVVTLESLVRMKLTSYRNIDSTHLRDMLEIGLIEAEWKNKFTPELGARLQQLIDTPEL